MLEVRELPATFLVNSLAATGPGSLRAAIKGANASPGADVVNFSVTGVIRAGRSSLPAVTGPLTIDGTSAPNYAGTPLVTLDFNRTNGLRFARGADGSKVLGLALVRAGNSGVTIDASGVTVAGCYIGVQADGTTAAGNAGDGIRINRTSRGNLIGRANPVSSVSYYDTSAITPTVDGWQGIRAGDTAGTYQITGTAGNLGMLYVGPISGIGGTAYTLQYPGATNTSVYGPDNLGNGNERLVGTYRNGDGMVHGFVYEGAIADLGGTSGYRTIDYPNATYTYVHSTAGGLAVGNADGPVGNLPIGTGHAFLYDVAAAQFLPDVVYPGSTSTTAYGIWDNGDGSYTIGGGYTAFDEHGDTVSRAYLVDYDAGTRTYSRWTTFTDPNAPATHDVINHFQGISSVESGVYTLAADSLQVGAQGVMKGSLVTVRRNTDGSFGPSWWAPLDYTNSTGLTSANSVYGPQVVGIVPLSSGIISYQATVNMNFQLSNVIAGNRGNGVGVYGATDSRISMNFIGTDATGSVRLANRRNGVLLTDGAARNMVGGQATGGNNPTAGVFVRPPQGNLISGNGENGVSITRGATRNVLSGNFVGTTASGNSALGNRLDGVAIERADGNALIGCTLRQSPFVFYNVISGNGRNGLRITDANDTTVHANFLGVGANNATVVANGEDGLLVSGSSRNTQVGGVIPLGNVISGNTRNGIEVRDRASGFVSFNTFGGVFAFGGAAPNGENGILVTSRGGNNLIRTSIIGGNRGNGIEIGGDATGVQVTETGVGVDSSLQTAIPNGGDGIRISGNAHGNSVGGFQPSIEPKNTISGNRGYGVAIVGRAHHNAVYHSVVGGNVTGTTAVPNGLDGVLLDAGTHDNVIGGDSDAFRNDILYNGGDGIVVRASRRNRVLGNRVGGNGGFGLEALGDSAGTLVRGDVFFANALGAVSLTKSRGVVYIS